MDEILDLVDQNDNVIGKIERSNYKKLIEQKLGYIRASELFIISDEGKLWIPMRTSSKTIAPNGYDYSAAGHVESGDNYTDTIIRETKEEINLDITEAELQFITKMKSEGAKYFRSVYLHRSNVTPSFNPADFTSAEWLTPDEVIENIDNGHPAKSSLRETLVLLKDYLSIK